MKVVTEEDGEAKPAWRGRRKRKAKSHVSTCLCNFWAGGTGDKMMTRRAKCLSQSKSSLFQSHFNLLKARLRVAAFSRAALAGALVILCIRKQSWV